MGARVPMIAIFFTMCRKARELETPRQAIVTRKRTAMNDITFPHTIHVLI